MNDDNEFEIGDIILIGCEDDNNFYRIVCAKINFNIFDVIEQSILYAENKSITDNLKYDDVLNELVEKGFFTLIPHKQIELAKYDRISNLLK